MSSLLFQTDEPPSPNHSPFRKSTGEVDFPPRANGNAKGVHLRFVSLASYVEVPKIGTPSRAQHALRSALPIPAIVATLLNSSINWVAKVWKLVEGLAVGRILTILPASCAHAVSSLGRML
jgi:hypothetical protein